MGLSKIALMGSIAVAWSASAAAQVKLTYNTMLPPTHVNNHADIEPFAKRIEAETKGAVKIELLTGGAVAKPQAAIDVIRDGVVNAGYIVDVYLPKEVPHSVLVTDLALVGRNSVAMSAATTEYQLLDCPGCVADLKKAGVIAMAYGSTAPYTLMCKPEVKSYDDLKGRKIRSASAWSLMFKSFGMVPVNITADETYEAMQRGQIDCTAGSDAWLKSFTLWDVAKHVVNMSIGTYHGSLLFAMHEDSWAKLAPEHKAAFRRNLPILIGDISFGYLDESRVAREGAMAKGVKFVEPDKSLVEAYETYAAKEIERLAEEGKKRGIKDPEPQLRTYLAKVAKWEKIVAEGKGDKQAYVDALNREIYSRVKF